MKITLKDGQEITFELRHIYQGIDQRAINNLIFFKKQFTETIRMLETTIRNFDSIAADVDLEIREMRELIDFYKEEIRGIKGRISHLKKFPIKTIASLQKGEIIMEAFASISQEDKREYMHCKRTGRIAAIRNLLKQCCDTPATPLRPRAPGFLTKAQRQELYQKLLPIN